MQVIPTQATPFPIPSMLASIDMKTGHPGTESGKSLRINSPERSQNYQYTDDLFTALEMLAAETSQEWPETGSRVAQHQTCWQRTGSS
jgi:hypothetical protein